MKQIGKTLKNRAHQALLATGPVAATGVKAFLMALAVLGAVTGAALTAAQAADTNDIQSCATVDTIKTTTDNSLVAPRHEGLVIVIRPSEPKVGRPVIAWIAGHQPGHLLVARRISWSFNNAASMLKDSGGGSASTVYLTPGKKKISVSVTDMSGKRKKATCSLVVTW